MRVQISAFIEAEEITAAASEDRTGKPFVVLRCNELTLHIGDLANLGRIAARLISEQRRLQAEASEAEYQRNLAEGPHLTPEEIEDARR